MKQIIYTFIFSLLFFSCEIGPKPIHYGEDGCEYCKMTIVDNQHASELVTSKGKVYKFDAIECMVNFRKEHKDIQYALYLVSDYSNPGEMVDATMATFLISKNISSPMGANLAAFQDQRIASDAVKNYGGKLYTWNEILPVITRN